MRILQRSGYYYYNGAHQAAAICISVRTLTQGPIHATAPRFARPKYNKRAMDRISLGRYSAVDGDVMSMIHLFPDSRTKRVAAPPPTEQQEQKKPKQKQPPPPLPLKPVEEDLVKALVATGDNTVIADSHRDCCNRIKENFVNPFTGRLTVASSDTAKQLMRIGFKRAEDNCLHLEWSYKQYMEGYNRTHEALMKRKILKGSNTKTEKMDHETVVRDLLRHFEQSNVPWRVEVAQLVRREDAPQSVNREIDKRYSALTVSYKPPKLDAATDPAVSSLTLTPDQQHVVELAMQGYHLYIGGSAGTGKTVLLKRILREFIQRGLRVAMTATTGVAAVQLGGCTFHHAFNIPVDDHQLAQSNRRWDINALRAVDVVIVDEVSLLSASLLDAFDMEARLARMNIGPFGGIQVILCGDFLQLSNGALGDEPVYKSGCFKNFVPLKLVTPMRHRSGDPLLALLMQLRRGIFDAEAFQPLERPVPEDATQITYLFPRKRDAQQLNDAKLAELLTSEMVCTPQRGMLHVVGHFTSSACITFPSTTASLPGRDEMVRVMQEEVQSVCPAAGVILDPNCVFMPAKSSTTLALLVRLRHNDMRGGSNPALDSVPAGGSQASNTRVPRGAAALTAQQWVDVAERFANRVGGVCHTLYEVEPQQLVPLSVTMGLADLSDGTVAEVLAPLRLKLGCRVMINRNLSRTVSNGSVGIVEAFAEPDIKLFPQRNEMGATTYYRRIVEKQIFEKLPIVRLMSGEVVQIPPICAMLGGTPASYYYGHEVYSLPLQLGYGFTVHKVQGLTLLGTVILDCKHFFECPHLIYVACSRVKEIDQLIVRGIKSHYVTVKRSALQFADQLLEAKDTSALLVSPDHERGAWVSRVAPRVLSLNE